MLSISGSDLDVEEVIRVTGITPYSKKKKGEPRFKTKPEGEKMPHSVVSAMVSDADFDQLPQQVADAISYLEQHGGKLALLAGVPGVEAAELDFGVSSNIDEDEKFCESFRFPAKLLWLAGEAGVDVRLSVYSPKSKNKLGRS